jgi:imidazolonepropionase
MALACRQLHMSPAEALAACTVNAAHALRLGHRIGSLEAGTQADMLLLESDDYRHLAYWVGHNPVVTVFKKGERISG